MNKYKKIIILVASFIVPLLIVFVYIFFTRISYPKYLSNGNNILVGDMFTQYNSLFSYIKDVYTGSSSIFYSFSKSIGGNMASTVGYYLSSPFNIIYIFFSKNDLPLCSFLILLLKIGFTGLFMSFFLLKRFEVIRYSSIAFSVIYALSGYMINFYFNIMWLDVVMLTPLVMYGINCIIEKEKIYPYSILLCISIISNFYISFMLCIFCVIYFLFEIVTRFNVKDNKKKIKAIIIKFVVASLIGTLMSSFILIPTLKNLSEINRIPLNESNLTLNIAEIKNVLLNDVLSKLYIGSFNDYNFLSKKMPNIYFGMLSLLLCCLYFINNKIKLKEKIITFIIILFFLLSFTIPILNVLWHGLSVPNGYNARYSFLFIFFLIFISYKSFIKLDKIKLIPSLIFIILFLILSKYFYKQNFEFLKKNDVVISCIFFIGYYILIFFISNFKKIKKMLLIILVIASIFEIYLNFSKCFVSKKEINIYEDYNIFYKTVCSKINNLDNKFYRISGNYIFSDLDPIMCGTNGIEVALSTNEKSTYNMLYKYGYSMTYITIFNDINVNHVMDSILGIKYIYSISELNDFKYELIDKIEIKGKYNKKDVSYNIYIYKNRYAQKLGFLISNDYNDIYKKNKKNNTFERLNTLVKSMTGVDKNIYEQVEREYLGNNEYIFKPDSSKNLYLSYDYQLLQNWGIYDQIHINDTYVTTGISNKIGIIEIPNKYFNQDIILKIGDNNDLTNTKEISSLYMYTFNEDYYKQAMESLKRNSMYDIKVIKNTVKGKINVKDNKILFLSIPYDKGWNIYIDGKKIKYFKIGEGFIGIKVPKGKHNIKMKYYSPYYKCGIILSIISIIILISYSKFISKNKSFVKL